MSIHASNNPSECSSTSVDGAPFSQFIEEQIESQTSQNYTQKGGYPGTTQDLKNEFDSINFEGVKVWDTLSEAQAVTPTPADYTGFSVNPNTDPENAGQYYYLASEQDGTKFYRDFISKTDDLDDETGKVLEAQAAKEKLISKSSVNAIEQLAGNDILTDLKATSLSDPNEWGDGFLFTLTAIVSNASYKYSINYYDIFEGEYTCTLRFIGNAKMIIYNSNYEPIQIVSNPNASGYNFNFTVNEGGRYFRISHQSSQPLTNLNLERVEDFIIPNDRLLSYKGNERADLESNLESLDFYAYQVGKKIAKEMATDLADYPDFWTDGLLLANDTILYSAAWRTSDYVQIDAGDYNCNYYVTGNARFITYDEQLNPVQVISDEGNSTATTNWILTISDTEKYIRFSIDINRPYEIMSVSPRQKTQSRIRPKNSREIINLTNKAIITNIGKNFEPKINKPIISLISDDGHKDNDWYVSALDTYGFKSTFAIVKNFMDNPSYYNRSEVIQLFKDGHDLAGHSVSHDSVDRLADLTESELHDEIGDCLLELKSLENGIRPDCFVSPYGSRNETVDRIVRTYFKNNFITQPSTVIGTPSQNNYPIISNYQLNRVSLDATVNDVSRYQIIIDAIDYTIANGGWLVLAIHPQFTEYGAGNSVDRRQEIRDILNYIKTQGVKVLTASQAFDYYKNIEIGYPTFDKNYYQLGADGTEDNNLIK